MKVVWMNLNPREVNLCWWGNKSHQSRWWPVCSPHHVGSLPLRDCEMSLTNLYILNLISVLLWLPFLTGTHCHDLWHFPCLLPHCCLSQPFLAAFAGGGIIPWDYEVLGQLQFELICFSLIAFSSFALLGMVGCIAPRVLPSWIHGWIR